MRRIFATVALLAVLTAAWLPTQQAHASLDSPPRTVVILAPYLRWSDLTATSTPILWSLAERGSIGNVNSRSRERLRGEPGSVLEGALTLSSGVWAVPPIDAAPALNADERYGGGTGAQSYTRSTGRDLQGSAIAYVGMPAAQRANASTGYRATPGVLGQGVSDARAGVNIAVGNSDTGLTGAHDHVRPAAIAAMDLDGLVDRGDVSTRVLTTDPNAPFGVRTDLRAFSSILETLPADLSGLAVLDAGDMYRAVAFAPRATPQVAARMRTDALRTLDAVTGLAEEKWPYATIIVVSMSTADGGADGPEEFGPIIVWGPDNDWPSKHYLTSDSTQRIGLVTSLDVAATVLQDQFVQPPVEIVGNAIRTRGGPPALWQRIAHLSRMSATAVAVDAAKGAVVNTFVGLTVIVLLIGALVISAARRWRAATACWWVTVMKAALLLVACAPMAGWLMFAVLRWPGSVTTVYAVYLLCLAVTWIAALVASRRVASRVPVAAVALATAAVICVDQWLGAPGSFTNFFSYSPIAAARFYGMGNEAASILFGGSLVGLSLLFDQWPESAHTTAAKRIALPAVGVAVVVSAAAPFWGANVGVAIWGIVGFGLAYVLMNGYRVTWKSVAWIVLAVIAVIGAFIVIDRLGGSQTHLARALGSADQGGLSQLWQIVERKAETNLRVLTATNWAYILAAVLAFLGFMRWRPQGDFAATLAENPHFSHAITASMVAGLVAYFTEDSGIVIPALIVFWVGVAIVWLMLGRLVPAEESARHPDGDDR